MTPSAACFALIRQFEGCARLLTDGQLKAYADPATGGPPWTIGWGSTGPDIAPGTIWTQGQCDARLVTDVTLIGGKVERLLDGAETSQHQLDALICFAYNLGIGNLGTSTLMKMHKAGNFTGAAQQFGVWVKANGKILPGLVKRRAAESSLYATPDNQSAPELE